MIVAAVDELVAPHRQAPSLSVTSVPGQVRTVVHPSLDPVRVPSLQCNAALNDESDRSSGYPLHKMQRSLREVSGLEL